MSKYTQNYSENKNGIFGQIIRLLYSFLRNLNTKIIISPEAQICENVYQSSPVDVCDSTQAKYLTSVIYSTGKIKLS